MTGPSAARLRRLAEELEEIGLPPIADPARRDLVVEEIDHALRPAVHERRVVSSGVIIDPGTAAPTWPGAAQLGIVQTPVPHQSRPAARRFADGLSSWLVRRTAGDEDWLMFDRPAGSARDLVVLASALDATIVQRHPSGVVRVVGRFGVLRWQGVAWHHEPPVSTWIDAVATDAVAIARDVLKAMAAFAVHDLGAQGVGALLILRADDGPGPFVEERLALPPPLQIRTAFHLAPLRHALGQVDGAAVFDHDGVLRQLGVRLVPSATAERAVDALGGTRHTSARRYSFDDPTAAVIAISDDGPVSVMRNGAVLASTTTAPRA